MPDIYQQHIRSTRLADLRNHGYNIVMIDYKNSHQSIVELGKGLAELIDHFKCNFIYNTATDTNKAEQFIVGGKAWEVRLLDML